MHGTELEIVHKDGDIVVVNKPSGKLSTHRGDASSKNACVEDMLKEQGIDFYRAVHRLDRQTTGLLIFSRHAYAHDAMQRKFMDREVSKLYLGMAIGNFEGIRLKVEEPLTHTMDRMGYPRTFPSREGDKKAKPATTLCEGLAYYEEEGLTLMAYVPLTGRTHQIRAHAAHIGFPLNGDQRYLPAEQGGWRKKRRFKDAYLLHATALEFTHPMHGEPLYLFSSPSWARDDHHIVTRERTLDSLRNLRTTTNILY